MSTSALPSLTIAAQYGLDAEQLKKLNTEQIVHLITQIPATSVAAILSMIQAQAGVVAKEAQELVPELGKVTPSEVEDAASSFFPEYIEQESTPPSTVKHTGSQPPPKKSKKYKPFTVEELDEIYNWAIAKGYRFVYFPNAWTPGQNNGYNAGWIVNEHGVGVDGNPYTHLIEETLKNESQKMSNDGRCIGRPRAQVLRKLEECRTKGYVCQFKHLNFIRKMILQEKKIATPTAKKANLPAIKGGKQKTKSRLVFSPEERERMFATILDAAKIKSEWTGNELRERLRKNAICFDAKQLNKFMHDLMAQGKVKREGAANASGKYVFTVGNP